MTVTAIVGTQWGDEGKGRIVDFLAQRADMVIRFQGGDNAGHTVIVGDTRFALHLLPSGSVRPETLCVITNGVVIDPQPAFGTLLKLVGLICTGLGRSIIGHLLFLPVSTTTFPARTTIYVISHDPLFVQ